MLVNRVKDYRKGRGLTQEDLASKKENNVETETD